MAGIKISELPLLVNPIPEDILVVVHDDGTDTVTMQSSIQHILDMLKPFELGAFTVTPNTVSVGTSLNSALLSWTTNKVPDSIQISGIGTIPNTETSHVIQGPITETTVFTITVTKNGQSITKAAAITFGNYRYFGVSPLTSFVEDDIKQLQKEMATTRSKDIIYDCTGGNYFVYAYPKTLGQMTSETKVNGYPWNDWVIQEIDITNQNGFTEPYYVYRSFNKLNGNYIPVSWR